MISHSIQRIDSDSDKRILLRICVHFAIIQVKFYVHPVEVNGEQPQKNFGSLRTLEFPHIRAGAFTICWQITKCA